MSVEQSKTSFISQLVSWQKHFQAVKQGNLQLLSELLSSWTDQQVTCDILEEVEGTTMDLLSAAVHANHLEIVQYLLETHTWGYRKTQTALSLACGGDTFTLFLALGLYPSLYTLAVGFFLRPVHTTHFGDPLFPHSNAVKVCRLLIDTGIFTAQQLLHPALFGDHSEVVQMLLDEGALVTHKIFFIFGYHSVILAPPPDMELYGTQSSAPTTGAITASAWENFRCYFCIREALEQQTGERLLPEWVPLVLEQGQHIKRSFLAQLQMSVHPGPVLGIRQFERLLLVEEDNLDAVLECGRANGSYGNTHPMDDVVAA
eukprot:NODE_3096_length_1030_cov_36.196013_g2952_i0.p1 GENE.NODE_3096_length_1030_cov_36.196013_g2952_i0~~NODE_3096_length_1030_cov_36.196013_g2952_i0.p1  ORF type:complete len:316 (-),score=83.39 NODE_3096_length_1030_cov_36.196013_g2952_i0:20-967(-)